MKALSFADELILVDKSSTDRTREIALPLVDKLVVVPWSPVVEPTRAFAESLCKHDWVLFLDDDECLSAKAILAVFEELVQPRADVYRLPQRHYILGVHDESAYYWPELQIRFYKKGALKFGPKVHAGLEIATDRVWSFDPADGICIHHLSYRDINQWIEKTNRYTSQMDRLRMFPEDQTPDLVSFCHLAIDRWMAQSKASHSADPEYVSVVAVLRAVYEIIDRLKSWEEQREKSGAELIAKVCQNLESEYAVKLAQIGRRRDSVKEAITLAEAQMKSD